MTMSFDVARHKHVPIEIYGEAGSLIVPDPNFFGGAIEVATAAEDWREVPTRHAYADGNYRILGLADMAQAIRDRPAAPGERRPRLARARSDGGVPEVLGRAARRSRLAVARERPAPMPATLKTGELD